MRTSETNMLVALLDQHFLKPHVLVEIMTSPHSKYTLWGLDRLLHMKQKVIETWHGTIDHLQSEHLRFCNKKFNTFCGTWVYPMSFIQCRDWSEWNADWRLIILYVQIRRLRDRFIWCKSLIRLIGDVRKCWHLWQWWVILS